MIWHKRYCLLSLLGLRGPSLRSRFFNTSDLINSAKVGLSASLSVVGLGPGKLFVRSDLGRPVIRALRAYVLRIGRSLRNTDVVVSSEYRALVMGLIEHKAP